MVAVGLEEEIVVRGVMVMVVKAEVKPSEAVVDGWGKSVRVPEPASARELLSLTGPVGVEGW